MNPSQVNRALLLMKYLENISRWQKNPLDYFVERLGIRRETIDWGLIDEYKNHQWDGTVNPMLSICESISQGKWTAVESATAVGKTYIGACLVLWFFECFENALVITTAPKEKQLQLHIWKEIGKLYNKFNIGTMTKLLIRMYEGKDEWIIVGFVAGVKADEESATRAQGFHAEHLLIVLEETPGIPIPIIEAFQNTATAPHNIILAFGNPDHQLDALHTFSRLKNVNSIRVSALDHPNIVLKNAQFIPGATSEQGLDRLLTRYIHKTNPMYMSRVRGISPEQSTDAVIRLEWCFKAAEKYEELCGLDDEPDPAQIKGMQALGVDVANSETGDDASVAYGIGNVLLTIESDNCPDANQLGHKINIMMNEKHISAQYVGVDGVGVGAGTVNALKEDKKNIVNLMSGSSPVEVPDMVEQFGNLRAQMWWQLRLDLSQEALILPKDDELFADLITPKMFIRSGKIYIEEKQAIKDRLGRSPNKGDSVVYWNWVRSRRTTMAAVAGAKKKEDNGNGNGKNGNETNPVFRYQPATGRRPTTF